jgi:RNA polymerase sigma factor (TIGR02999 family)
MPNPAPARGEITALLAQLRAGDRTALDRLFPLVYSELRDRAHWQLERHRPGDTLDTVGLVHEVYLKLTDSARQSYNDRIHFYAVASRAMRQILVDYARQRMAEKRGGGARPVSLDPADLASPARAEELVALDGALDELAGMNERLARTVELRFFAGLSVEETAEVMGVSPRTVKRDWQAARAFLFHQVRRTLGP